MGFFNIFKKLDNDYEAKSIIYFENNDWPNAIDCCKKVIEQSKGKVINPEVYHRLGVALEQIGDYQSALAFLKKVIDLDPDHIWAPMAIGNQYDKLGNKEEALIWYKKAAAMGNSNAALLAQMIEASLLDNLDCLSSQETNVNTEKDKKLLAFEWDEKGQNASKSGDINFAIDCYTKAIEIYPNDAAAYFQRGLIYQGLNDFTKALNDYDKSLKADLFFSKEIYYNKGVIYWHSGNYEKVLYNCNKTIGIDPTLALVYYYRGDAYFHLNQYDNALLDYSRVIELNPNFSTPYYNSGIIYEKLRDYSKALIFFKETISLDCDNAVAYFHLGGIYALSYDPKTAAENYNHYLRLAGNKYGDAERVRNQIRNLGYRVGY